MSAATGAKGRPARPGERLLNLARLPNPSRLLNLAPVPFVTRCITPDPYLRADRDHE
jgi:hypothetical protein